MIEEPHLSPWAAGVQAARLAASYGRPPEIQATMALMAYEQAADRIAFEEPAAAVKSFIEDMLLLDIDKRVLAQACLEALEPETFS